MCKCKSYEKSFGSMPRVMARSGRGGKLAWRSWRGAPSRGNPPGLPESDGARRRYIEAAIDGMIVGCLCNRQSTPGPKFDYKLHWFDRLAEHAGACSRAASSRAQP